MCKTSLNGSAYQLDGPADAPLLVLIHGLGLNRNVWESFIPRLAQRYRVLTYDLYGHGESASPPVKPDLRLYSEQLRELLDELAIQRCSMVGFSLGGMINRRFAIDHPDRLEALVIMNSPHERGTQAQQQVEQRALDSASGGPGATLEAAIERWFSADFIAANPEYIDRVRGWVLANDADDYAASRQVLAFGVIELIRPDPPIAHPTLVVTCEFDSGSTPAMSQAIAAEISAAQVIVVPGLRHMGLVENPSFFITAIAEFLDAVAASRKQG